MTSNIQTSGNLIKTKAKNGELTLQYEGIHLHSCYNPSKEAETFVDISLSNEVNNKFVILGLGLGYHLKTLVKKLDEVNYKYTIHVIEPSKEIFESYKASKNFIENNQIIFHIDESISSVFENYEFSLFLASRPKVLTWQASLKASKDYFSRFLSYRSPQKPINDINHNQLNATKNSDSQNTTSPFDKIQYLHQMTSQYSDKQVSNEKETINR